MTLNFVAVFFTMIVHAALYLLREKDDSVTAAKLEELKQRKAREADSQSKPSSTSTADINLEPIGSSKSVGIDSAEDADKDGPKHEHDDEGHEVEEPLLERFLSWRHFVFSCLSLFKRVYRMDLVWDHPLLSKHCVHTRPSSSCMCLSFSSSWA
jgi:hypothetical protein